MTFELFLRNAGLIARDGAPFASGNLVYSIETFPTPRGGRITQLGNIAFYGPILETGSKFFIGHRYWWSGGVSSAVGNYANDLYNGIQTNLTATAKSVATKMRDNPARQRTFLNSILYNKGE